MELVNKNDLQGVRHEIREMENRLSGDMREMRAQINGELVLIKWMLVFLGAGVLSIIVETFF